MFGFFLETPVLFFGLAPSLYLFLEHPLVVYSLYLLLFNDAYPPTDFNGFYSYDSQCNSYGAELSWTAPVTTPLHYKIYRNCIDTGVTYSIELDADVTDYIDDVEIGDYIYRLTAVYEDCESDYALTASGDDYILINVSNVPENVYEKITTVKAVYNLAGQRLNCSDLNDLPDGVYIVQGVTDSGKTVTQKIVK